MVGGGDGGVRMWWDDSVEEKGLYGTVAGGNFLKWAMVIHHLPGSLETRWMYMLTENPTGLYTFLYLYFILFLFLYVCFSVSLCWAFIVASRSHLFPSLLLPLLPQSVGMFFFFFWLDTNLNFFSCQPATAELLRTLLFTCTLYTCSDTFIMVLKLNLDFAHFFLLRVDPMPHDTPKPPGYTRFVCISDTHSRTDAIQMPYGDVFIHAGDFTELGLPSEVKKFNDWLG